MQRTLKEQPVSILMHIGAILRLDVRQLSNEPPVSTTLQVVRSIRARGDRRQLAALSHVPYEPLPDELRSLLKQLRSASKTDKKTDKTPS
jgi:hypothetical protein